LAGISELITRTLRVGPQTPSDGDFAQERSIGAWSSRSGAARPKYIPAPAIPAGILQSEGAVMQFKAFEPGIEASGVCVGAFVEACKLFPSVVLRKLARHGVGRMSATNEIEVDPNGWYSQQGWLTAFEEIANGVGPRVCFQIGRNVPRFATFPPTITDIYSGVASVDVAYHLNHRKAGRVMFDPATGRKTVGIGNYGFQPAAGERKITCVCENPYPCDFDRGILTEIASKFERTARVNHDEQAGCRKTGGNSCTYIVTW
jgi:hypothetical protein